MLSTAPHSPLGRVLALAIVFAQLLLGPTLVSAYPGAPWFEPGKPYTQNFPDPAILRVGDTYYAYATNTGGSYLPVMSSTDLQTWVARPAYDPGAPLNSDRYFNDALPYPAGWAPDRAVDGRMKKTVWAPGVAQLGGRFVAYYAVQAVLDDPWRFCISVATSGSPLGPFRDNTTAPLVCDVDPGGSIDPAPFVDTDGTPYLLWKAEGIPGSQPARIYIRRLSPDGLSFAAGSEPVELLRTSQDWEGNVVENPSLVRHGGRLHLFYSGNDWRSASYAMGYAECARVTGPCAKWGGNPLIASGGERLGPGGSWAFVDRAGQLQLAYHFWNAPYTDYPAYPACEQTKSCTTEGQRRLRVEPVSPPAVLPPAASPPAEACFAQTGRCVRGAFLAYWQANGGLAIYGYPLSEERSERLEDGEEYTVQWFERARFEYHPENEGTPYTVLLGQFGRRIRPADPPVAPTSPPGTPGRAYFAETGHNLGGRFLQYWQANGGLAQFGYPISEEFTERLEDGRVYTVQYFERARFEHHPENAPPYDVLLGQFGRRLLERLEPR